jgi:hypothetical protein
MAPSGAREERRPTVVAAALVALVALLPFARGLLSGASFYFRDLSRHFFPLRRFVAEGLRSGELRYWNPLVHEGEPLPLPPLSYLPDAVHALLPSEWFFSLLLALHVPLAALAFFALAREMGTTRRAAAGGALVYALAGFALSSLNLYVFLQAVAWAPLVVRGFLRVGGGTWREAALAALPLGVALTTTGVEVVAQTVVIALVLAGSVDRSRWGRFAAALALGAGVAAYTLLPVTGLVAGSARGAGFPADVVLSHSIHPLAFAQAVIAGFLGDASQGAGRFWGQRYSPLGFPYVLSVYVGATVLALAALGVVRGRGPRWRLAALAAAAVVVCLGSWAGLGPIVEALEPLRRFRYPSKAWFTVHFAVALLATLGIDALQRGEGPGPARRLALLAGLAGAPLVAAPLLPRLLPGTTRWFVLGFFPPEMAWGDRIAALRFMTADALVGGLVALAACGLAWLVARDRLAPAAAAAGIAALVGADMLRAGAGLNPMVAPSFFRLSPEMSAVAARLRQTGGRIFTCDVAQSPAYLAARASLGAEQESWSFALLRETLTPFYNLEPGVPTALSLDLTMLTPRTRVASPDEASCRDLASFLPRLREAGARDVLSLDVIEADGVRLSERVEPAALRPLAVHLYSIEDPRSRFEIAQGTVSVVGERSDDLEIEVDSPGGVLVLRQAPAAGWRARVNGREVRLERTESDHVAVEVPPGRSRVRLDYRPPRQRLGVTITIASLAALGLLARRRRPAP